MIILNEGVRSFDVRKNRRYASAWTILELQIRSMSVVERNRRRHSRSLLHSVILRVFFFPLFEMSFVVFCLFHRNIFLLFWYLVFSEKEMPISHITNTLTATCVGSLKRFWSRSPFFFFCSFPFTPPLSSLLFLPPTISVVFSIFSFFIFLSLNSNHLNNESGKTSRGKRCP